MINKVTIQRIACRTAVSAAMLLAGGILLQVHAQRDPFKKADWANPKKVVQNPTTAKAVKAAPVPVNYGPPPIEARIDYFKRLREAARTSGVAMPKVTSVLTLDEMTVTGIFKTPRGYAAMVEATPIKLSYTIYPGEKFFDGQLVAIEENGLVFRKVTKVGEGKFVASVENKPLRKFTQKSELEGTAPTQTAERQAKPVEVASNVPPANPAATPANTTTPATTAATDQKANKKPASYNFRSPLDEMNSQPDKPAAKDKTTKTNKKPAVKVASATSPK
jgi:hypothetical protein